jgi:putative ABC transport system permease protein
VRELPRVPRVLRLWRRGRVVSEVQDELAFHLEMRTRELMSAGASATDARAEALRQFGDLNDATTYCRRTGERRERRIMRTEWLSGLKQDVTFATRTLLRAPAFTVVAVLTLALGIGANTAIFSVVRGILLRPFPFSEPDRLVMVGGASPDKPITYNVSPANAYDWRAQNRAFTDMAIMNSHGVVLTQGGTAEMLQSVAVSPGYFNILGVTPLAGRLVFNDAEGAWQGEKAVVINEDLWRTRFGASANTLGSMITLDNERYHVVGIVPSAMAWPREVMAWMPFTYDPAQLADSRGGIYLNVIARLKPGVTLANARADMEGVAHRLFVQYPDDNSITAQTAHVVPLNEWVTGSLRAPLLVLLGGVGFVLLIACANVANLLMVRGVTRASELAVRTALGAGRGRLVRQLVTESVILALVGGLGATVLALVGTRLLVHAAPATIPRLDSIHLDGAVLALTFGIALVVGVIFGLIPAWQLVRPDLANTLRAGGRGLGTGGTGQSARRALVIAEVALSVMLLAGAGLLIRSFTRLMSVDPGFRTEHSIHYGVSLPRHKYPTQESRGQFVSSLLDRMRTVKGVQVAGASFGMPLTPFGFALTFTVTGRPPVRPAEQPGAQIRMATPDYFRAMSITMQKGRNFTDADRMGSPQVLLINAAAAAKFFPGEDPIGKHVNFGMNDGDNVLQGDIVGVASDVKQASLSRPTEPQFWVPLAQFPMSSFNVVLHTSTDPNVVINEARRDLHDLDPDLAMSRIMTLDQMVATAVSQPRFYMTLLSVFAALALILCAIGIYGVIAYLVGQREREIGIRIALGATQGNVVGLVVREGIVMVVMGLVAGVAGALALTRLMSALLFNTQANDPVTYAVVIGVLSIVALAASSVPAFRAARVDPALAMRAE